MYIYIYQIETVEIAVNGSPKSLGMYVYAYVCIYIYIVVRTFVHSGSEGLQSRISLLEINGQNPPLQFLNHGL